MRGVTVQEIDLGFKFNIGDTVLVGEEQAIIVRLWGKTFRGNDPTKLFVDRCYTVKIKGKQNTKYPEDSLKKITYDENGIAF